MGSWGTNRPLVRRASMVAVVALVLAACGSTAEQHGIADPTGAAGGASGLAAPGGSSVNGSGQGGTGGTTGAGGIGSTGGGTTGGTTATGDTGGGAGTSTTGDIGGTGGSSAGGTSGGGVAEPGDGPGVSSTTINVADYYDPDASAADQAIGAAYNPGDTKAEEQAVVDYVNAHGGVAHRKINMVWFKASVSQDANTTSQQACAYWTQDNKSFIIGGGNPIFDQCTANAHAIGVTAGAITLETTATNAQYPADVNLTGTSIDRGMRYTIEGLAGQGYFAKGAKVGIATWDADYYHYGIGAAAVPALAALGIHNVPVQYIAVPNQYGDLGATSASVSSAVLKFQQLGIDHVILFDGPAGVNASGILVLEWMQQANSQGYKPRYGLNSTSGFSQLAGDYPAQQMVNSIGVSWNPWGDTNQADYGPSKLPAAGKLCTQIEDAAGQHATSNSQLAVQLYYCDKYFFLQQTLDPISGPLNQQTALAAINASGSSYHPLSTFAVSLSANRHDGASEVANMAFVPACTCYRYTSAPYAPGG